MAKKSLHDTIVRLAHFRQLFMRLGKKNRVPLAEAETAIVRWFVIIQTNLHFTMSVERIILFFRGILDGHLFTKSILYDSMDQVQRARHSLLI